jgi:hypothetical protein
MKRDSESFATVLRRADRVCHWYCRVLAQNPKSKMRDLVRTRVSNRKKGLGTFPAVHFSLEKSEWNTILPNVYDQTSYCTLVRAAPI